MKKASHTSTKCKAPSTLRSVEPPKKTRKIAAKKSTEEDSETSETDESLKSDRNSEDDRISYRGEVQAEEDWDEMLEFALTDQEKGKEEFAEGEMTWEQWYNAPERHTANVQEHFLACFLKYLRHPEGGLISNQQSLLHVRQVHKVLKTLERDGSDLNYLLINQCMNVWDGFCVI